MFFDNFRGNNSLILKAKFEDHPSRKRKFIIFASENKFTRGLCQINFVSVIEYTIYKEQSKCNRIKVL